MRSSLNASGLNVKLGVFFQDRVAPGIRKLKELVDAGKLGKPILVSGRVKWYRPPEYYSGPRWRGTWALDGGGALMNQGRAYCGSVVVVDGRR